jgi:hypothetical protein
MASRRSEVLGLVKRLEDHGCKCVQSRRRSHWKIYMGGKMVGSIGSTPSDRHAVENALHDLAKAGVILP